MRNATELITASRLKDARACKRLHHYRYDLGYRPVVDADELRFGTLIHNGLEAWWRAAQETPDQQDVWLFAALEQVGIAEADPFDKAKARVLLSGYHYRWKDEPYTVLAVEETFQMALVNPESGAASRTWRLAGKVDVLVLDRRDNQKKLVEHKTSSEDITPGSEYWRRLRMDSQISVYFDGAGELQHDVSECVYDVVGKLAHRPKEIPVEDAEGVKIVRDASGDRVRTKDGKKWRETADKEQGFVLETRPETPQEFEARVTEAVAQAPEKYFARGSVVRLERELDEHRYDLWQTAKELRDGELAKRFPRNPDACSRYGRTCAFFDVCTGAASLDDTTRFTRLTVVHPELSGETAAPPKEEASAS